LQQIAVCEGGLREVEKGSEWKNGAHDAIGLGKLTVPEPSGNLAVISNHPACPTITFFALEQQAVSFYILDCPCYF
jgi:hypothetical protein